MWNLTKHMTYAIRKYYGNDFVQFLYSSLYKIQNADNAITFKIAHDDKFREVYATNNFIGVSRRLTPLRLTTAVHHIQQFTATSKL